MYRAALYLTLMGYTRYLRFAQELQRRGVENWELLKIKDPA
jgi:hypothetical protein